jgi:alkylation response protein AidB-like acyl-CoA dehydrogenase
MNLLGFCKRRKTYYSVAHSNLCTHNILRNGTEQRKQKYLPELASAEMIGGLGLTDEALQIHGGWGYLTDFEVERMWRNAKLGEIGAGTNEIRQLLIARELLGMR